MCEGLLPGGFQGIPLQRTHACMPVQAEVFPDGASFRHCCDSPWLGQELLPEELSRAVPLSPLGPGRGRIMLRGSPRLSPESGPAHDGHHVFCGTDVNGNDHTGEAKRQREASSGGQARRKRPGGRAPASTELC